MQPNFRPGDPPAAPTLPRNTVFSDIIHQPYVDSQRPRPWARAAGLCPQLCNMLPRNWPPGLTYHAAPVAHKALAKQELAGLLKQLEEKAAADGAPLLHSPPLKGPCPLVSITPIHDPKHPACGQHGLFAARNLLAGSLVLDYVGVYVSDALEDPTSDYCLRLGPGLSMDAAHQGNEARFINDARGVKDKPNCKFDLYRDKSSGKGQARMGVFTTAAVKKGEELLLSYGRGFWKARLAGQDEEEWEVWERVAAEAAASAGQAGVGS